MKRALSVDEEILSSSAKKECHERNGKLPTITSLDAPVSPPRRRSRPEKQPPAAPAIAQRGTNTTGVAPNSPPNLAAIEAGQVEVSDHLSIFSSHLSQCIRPSTSSDIPRLQISDWKDLYRRNERLHGRHFVVHQHDHPIAGPHYDLRLQFSESSSVSWSVMYGLPGDPNSRWLNRNATETRVHCFWNHLIETASPNTGSMVIWDTGEYEVLPYQMESTMPETDDSRSVSEDSDSPVQEHRSESEKLCEAFQNRKIRLRLHGTRLPRNYTIILRQDKTTHQAPLRLPQKRCRRTRPRLQSRSTLTSSDSSPSPPSSPSSKQTYQLSTTQSNPEPAEPNTKTDSDYEKSDYQIRLDNAYPGSTNTIGSIHQRRWFITLDRVNSGFEYEPGKKRWVRKKDLDMGELVGFEPFYVRGPEIERSVVTGRLRREVLEDEGVQGFIPRQGWRAVLE